MSEENKTEKITREVIFAYYPQMMQEFENLELATKGQEENWTCDANCYVKENRDEVRNFILKALTTQKQKIIEALEGMEKEPEDFTIGTDLRMRCIVASEAHNSALKDAIKVVKET